MKRVRVYTEYDRKYNRGYYRRVRLTILLPHDYINSIHCRDCNREYNRELMRDVRWAAKI